MDIRGSMNGDKAELVLSGRFDFNAHREFRKHYGELLENHSVKSIDIDMAAVSYIDSAALGMLLLFRERAEQTGKKITLSHCRGAVAQVLEVANFNKLFDIR